MIYLFVGTDRTKLKKSLFALRDSLLKKKPNASFFSLDRDNWQESRFEEYLNLGGLFNHAHIVYLDNLLGDKDSLSIIEKAKKEIASSPNIFLILEQEMKKKDLDSWKKISASFVEAHIVSNKKEEFNVFSLTEELGRRNKTKLWTLFNEAIIREIPAENLIGVLIWQLRVILISSRSKNPSDSGLSPYVYNKAVAFSRNFKENEVRSMLIELVSIYHNARMSGPDLKKALEHFLLKI